VGRATHELPGWLDCARFVARPGEPQHDWEAPRTVTGTVKDRAARLKALGNAVDPVQFFPVMESLVAAHETWRGGMVERKEYGA
jgi:DNA (cytosine-5)-methyltransferase 1